MAKQVRKTERLLCVRCKVYTDHTLHASFKSSWSDDDADVQGGETNDFFECNGCHTAALRITGWFSEDQGERSVSYFPPRSDREPLRSPKDFDNVPYGSPLESVYRQTITAFNYKLTTLVSAGVRLLVEGICKDRGVHAGTLLDDDGKPRLNKRGSVIKTKDLEGKINGLVENGFISKNQAGVLHQIRYLGNDAAHELDRPKMGNLKLAIAIVEHLFEQVFEQPEQAKELAARKRPNRR